MTTNEADLFTSLHSRLYAEDLSTVEAIDLARRWRDRRGRGRARAAKVEGAKAALLGMARDRLALALDRGDARLPDPVSVDTDPSVIAAAEQYRREEAEDESLSRLAAELAARWESGRLPEIAPALKALRAARAAAAKAEREIAEARKVWNSGRSWEGEMAIHAANDRLLSASAAVVKAHTAIADEWGLNLPDHALNSLPPAA